MQFVQVVLPKTGASCWTFVLSKWEATALVSLGKNKKAPEDEQAVRFDVHNGQPVIWATDGTACVSVEPPPCPAPDSGMYVPAWSLKEWASKTRVNQMLLIPAETFQAFVVKKQELADLVTVQDIELIGLLTPCGALSWTIEQLQGVRQAAASTTVSSTGVSTWKTSGRFTTMLAAVSKAAEDADMTWLNPPASSALPLVVRVETGNGAVWTAAIMTRD